MLASIRMSSTRKWQNPRAVRNGGATKVAESLLLGEKLRRKVKAGYALGTFSIELSSPSSVAALALAGFDFIVLDMEHSPTGFATLHPLILAAQAAGIPAIVRPWGESPGLIGKILDMGAHGIMAAHVDTAQRAREIVEQTRFPPRGRRGFSPLTGFDALKHPIPTLDRSTYLIVQIEGRKALGQVDQIAAVPGIDAVFVGPYDLALSLGVSPSSPQVVDAARRAAKSVTSDVAMGIYIDDPATCGAWASRRFTLQCVSFDGRMLSNGARLVSESARKSVAARGIRVRKTRK